MIIKTIDTLLSLDTKNGNSYEFVVYGEPTNEIEYNQMVKFVTDTDSGGSSVFSDTQLYSWSEFSTEKTSLTTTYNNNKYQRDRKTSYPEWEEFAEAYTEKEIGGDSTKWDSYIVKYNKVRSDNPK
tara:strand:- start:14 stop:391 length:378 start_codon:yes stop_codon:yes gene_type:complete